MKKAISKIFSAFKRVKGDVENRATTEGGAEVEDDSMEREMVRNDTSKLMRWLVDKDGRSDGKFDKNAALQKVFLMTDADLMPVTPSGAPTIAMYAKAGSATFKGALRAT